MDLCLDITLEPSTFLSGNIFADAVVNVPGAAQVNNWVHNVCDPVEQGDANAVASNIGATAGMANLNAHQVHDVVDHMVSEVHRILGGGGFRSASDVGFRSASDEEVQLLFGISDVVPSGGDVAQSWHQVWNGTNTVATDATNVVHNTISAGQKFIGNVAKIGCDQVENTLNKVSQVHYHQAIMHWPGTPISGQTNVVHDCQQLTTGR